MQAGLTTARFPFLAQLSAGGRQALETLPVTHANAGQILLQRGDAVDGAYLVVRGSFRIYYVTASGSEATLYHVEPGATCVLALTSAFNNEPYPAWVESGKQGVSHVKLPTHAFRMLFDREPAFRHFVFAVLSGRIFELMRTLEEKGSAQIEQRVARYLTRRVDADGLVRMNQIGIASELGTAREVVYRALRSLAARGLVETGRARITILDPVALRKFGETAWRTV